ncbi:hypothetical protein FKX85_05890 [Echinicola soli]|uniref:Uncharacterized protein n=1 Tax=Echinicola soli TaxID=2591634 RepID=A0A514CFK4_9BACT|nr:hypothetical protein [Echinicola soli]QDH78586.1 hypothetical protein FKX85_05890 [Echinicola soli]
MPTKDPVLTPELLKIIKIFGLTSVGIVLVLSFFNEYRADNTNSNDTHAMADSNLLYFKNVRQLDYEINKNTTAKLEIFRLGKRLKGNNLIFVNLSIIISRIRNKAYIFIEPSERLTSETTVEFRWLNKGTQQGVLSFQQGDRVSHHQFVTKLYPLIDEEREFQVKIAGKWHPILVSSKERQAFKTTAEDYLRLIK